jgi:hypothetical protein
MNARHLRAAIRSGRPTNDEQVDTKVTENATTRFLSNNIDTQNYSAAADCGV